MSAAEGTQKRALRVMVLVVFAGAAALAIALVTAEQGRAPASGARVLPDDEHHRELLSHRTVHPYPTQAEAWKRLGDAHDRTRLKPWLERLFERYLGWRR